MMLYISWFISDVFFMMLSMNVYDALSFDLSAGGKDIEFDSPVENSWVYPGVEFVKFSNRQVMKGEHGGYSISSRMVTDFTS